MEIIKSETHYNFVAMMKMAVTASIVYILIGIGSIFWHGGLNFGIDFAGGTLIQIRFSGETSVEKLRQALKPIGMESSIIQQFGPKEMVVRTASTSADLKGISGQVENALKTSYGQGVFEIRRLESVGPKVGKDLTR